MYSIAIGHVYSNQRDIPSNTSVYITTESRMFVVVLFFLVFSVVCSIICYGFIWICRRWRNTTSVRQTVIHTGTEDGSCETAWLAGENSWSAHTNKHTSLTSRTTTNSSAHTHRCFCSLAENGRHTHFDDEEIRFGTRTAPHLLAASVAHSRM